MANIAVPLFGINQPFRLTDFGDGTYALTVQYSLITDARAAGDLVVPLFGLGLPIRCPIQSDGTFAIAIASVVNPRPAADASVPLFGINLPMRLVGFGDGSYALGATYQDTTAAATANDVYVSLFEMATTVLIQRQSSGDYALVYSLESSPFSTSDVMLSLFGTGFPIRFFGVD